MLRHCWAGVLLAISSPTWAALCLSSPSQMGTLVERTSWSSSENAFSATCSAVGNPSQDDAAAWSFSNRYHFSLDRDAHTLYSTFSLNHVQMHQVDPDSATPGLPFYMIRTDSIWLERDGVRTVVGGEGAGSNEIAHFFAFDLKAGDYTLGMDGKVFDTPTRTGFYAGNINVRYVTDSIAAPVPEPEAAALLLLGVPMVAWVARRKRGAAKAA